MQVHSFHLLLQHSPHNFTADHDRHTPVLDALQMIWSEGGKRLGESAAVLHDIGMALGTHSFAPAIVIHMALFQSHLDELLPNEPSQVVEMAGWQLPTGRVLLLPRCSRLQHASFTISPQQHPSRKTPRNRHTRYFTKQHDHRASKCRTPPQGST